MIERFSFAKDLLSTIELCFSTFRSVNVDERSNLVSFELEEEKKTESDTVETEFRIPIELTENRWRFIIL